MESSQRPPLIHLLQMPYAAPQHPSIGLGLLKAELEAQGLPCQTHYPCFRWYENLGQEVYMGLLQSQSDDLLAEWTFARAAFGDSLQDDRQYLEFVMGRSIFQGMQRGQEILRDVQQRAVAFIDEVAQSLLKQGPRIVGCSSSFQQNCASLALLRRLKQLDPSIITVMGGSNCESSMGVALIRNFDWLDYVVSGEADKLVAPFFRSLLEGRPQPIYGVLSRDPESWRSGPEGQPPRAKFSVMDQCQIPDYDDYFRALAQSSVDLLPGLLIETSRGCWWGQKHHCTFCGLNGGGMDYRSKSQERVLQELEQLSERYELRGFGVVDNILDHTHLKHVMPVLAVQPKAYRLFYETKSNLKFEQLELLAKAGVRWIQPGIESLHDEILSLMDKGSTGLMNILFLRNARELGIATYWNFLVCFPGEKLEWYAEMCQWLPKLSHLQPPIGMAPIRFDRFSPYHTNPQRYNISMQPARAYSQVYPLDTESLWELAYYFEDTPEQKSRPDRYMPAPERRQLYRLIQEWHKAFASPQPAGLSMIRDEDGRWRVEDSRPMARQSVYRLTTQAAELLIEARSPRKLDPTHPELPALVEAGLLLRIGDRYLSLPTLGQPAPLPQDWEFPAGSLHRPASLPAYVPPNLETRTRNSRPADSSRSNSGMRNRQQPRAGRPGSLKSEPGRPGAFESSESCP